MYMYIYIHKMNFKEFIIYLYYWYIELFTRKGITPNSGLTGPRILYIYIYVCVCVCVCVINVV